VKIIEIYRIENIEKKVNELEMDVFNLVWTHELIKLIKVYKYLFDRKVDNINTKDRIKVIFKIKWIISKKENNKLKRH
jgi:hypothetical protein